MISLPVRRIATGIMVLWLVASAAWAGPVSADTSGRAPITITIFTDGERDISWTNDPVIFLTSDGQPPMLNATTPSVVATASFSLDVTDTLPDGERPGYTIAISAGTFTAENVETTISPVALSLHSISSDPPLPDGYLASFVTKPTLDTSVKILTVPNGAEAVDVTITIDVAMTLTPGLMEGNYSGSIISSVSLLSSGAP